MCCCTCAEWEVQWYAVVLHLIVMKVKTSIYSIDECWDQRRGGGFRILPNNRKRWVFLYCCFNICSLDMSGVTMRDPSVVHVRRGEIVATEDSGCLNAEFVAKSNSCPWGTGTERWARSQGVLQQNPNQGVSPHNSNKGRRYSLLNDVYTSVIRRIGSLPKIKIKIKIKQGCAFDKVFINSL